MSLRFCVLGSGSSGNAAYVECDGYGLLIDAGLGPRRLTRGLADADADWPNVRAVLLTHTHGDHWHESTLGLLLKNQTAVYCHARHATSLTRMSATFGDLAAAGLVRTYEMGAALELGPIGAAPFRVPHDDDPTCGFRIESRRDGTCLGFVSDLGSWTEGIAAQLCDVDILAVEFNHDVYMERASYRSPMLISRVLSDRGHLSNEQGAALVAEVLHRSEPGRTQHLVMLHLSRQCNEPDLALAAAFAAVEKLGRKLTIHTSLPNAAGPVLMPRSFKPRRMPAVVPLRQAYFPGWHDDTGDECLSAAV